MFRGLVFLSVYYCHIGLLCGENSLPRGVSPDLAPMYDANRNFQCLDSGEIIPFDRVNDDYCDCTDGSDEPGTSACSNGKFYCENIGYRPMTIPSSRVNDGICDCCDGSDEWDHDAGVEPCQNTCNEVGAAARAEYERQLKMVEEGLKVKAEMIQEGTNKRTQKQKELLEKETQKTQAESSRAELEETKNKAEALEKEALDIYRAEEDAQRQREEEAKREIENAEIEASFAKLDSNQDGVIDLNDMKQFMKFDQNGDGTVSDEEGNFFLSGFDSYNMEDFKSTGWQLIKPYFTEETPKENEDVEPTATSAEDSETGQGEVLPDYDDEDYDDNGDLDLKPPKPTKQGSVEELEEHESREEDDSITTEEEKAKYDPETQRLIEAADQARSAYNEADRLVRDLEREVTDLTQELSKDYGPANEYYTISGQCFEYTDNEYTYKMCAYDYCSQRGKHGGSETRLGNFEGWNPAYKTMQFQKGVQCWNGPARSTNVIVSCGSVSQLIGASEPNKCEYEFKFETPAACNPIAASPNRGHDEL